MNVRNLSTELIYNINISAWMSTEITSTDSVCDYFMLSEEITA